MLADVLGISGAPSPGGGCPQICYAAIACQQSLVQLCSDSGGAFCLSTDLCPLPSFCNNLCNLGGP